MVPSGFLALGCQHNTCVGLIPAGGMSGACWASLVSRRVQLQLAQAGTQEALQDCSPGPGPSAGSRHRASWGPALTVPSEACCPGTGCWTQSFLTGWCSGASVAVGSVWGKLA